ncbi:6-phosphogluconolactonase [candidate division KSB1 bacterium]|nr:6-phosphogluconolactonase [candidate division KSB1 bacterium]
MKPRLNISQTTDEVIAQLVSEFETWIVNGAPPLTMALSGGSTPKQFFHALALSPTATTLPWRKLHLFWGDERCVPPDHPDSNYRMTKQYLLDNITIPPENIHRIRGENNPNGEAIRYAEEIEQFVPGRFDGVPVFDWILLGMGTDGHTASIFPNDDPKVEPKGYCAVATHPQSRQRRISLTMPLINYAKRITFLVTGASKAEMAKQILKSPMKGLLPAAQVNPIHGNLEWYLDATAAALLSS